MSKDKWKLVTEYTLNEYKCGARAGDAARLKHDIVVRDHQNKPTDKVYQAREIWTVLRGVAEEPNIVWLRQADGERHTWDDDVFFETFELLPRDTV